MAKSTARHLSALRQRLVAISQQLPSALEPLLDREPLFKGYVYLNPRRCGNPTCHCAHGELHEAWVVRTPKAHGQLSRIAKPEERERLLRLAGNYKSFRTARRRVVALLRETTVLLRQLEQARLIDPFAEKKRTQ